MKRLIAEVFSASHRKFWNVGGAISTWLSGDKMGIESSTLLSLTYFGSLCWGLEDTLISLLSGRQGPNPVFASCLSWIAVPESKGMVTDQRKRGRRMLARGRGRQVLNYKLLLVLQTRTPPRTLTNEVSFA